MKRNLFIFWKIFWKNQTSFNPKNLCQHNTNFGKFLKSVFLHYFSNMKRTLNKNTIFSLFFWVQLHFEWSLLPMILIFFHMKNAWLKAKILAFSFKLRLNFSTETDFGSLFFSSPCSHSNMKKTLWWAAKWIGVRHLNQPLMIQP